MKSNSTRLALTTVLAVILGASCSPAKTKDKPGTPDKTAAAPAATTPPAGDGTTNITAADAANSKARRAPIANAAVITAPIAKLKSTLWSSVNPAVAHPGLGDPALLIFEVKADQSIVYPYDLASPEQSTQLFPLQLETVSNGETVVQIALSDAPTESLGTASISFSNEGALMLTLQFNPSSKPLIYYPVTKDQALEQVKGQ